VNNIKLNIKLSYTKLKERFLKKRERVTVLNRKGTGANKAFV
jgi:hypothetical protein